MLKEFKTKTAHYFKNENGQIHGEYKSWWENGQLHRRSFYQNGELHGESKLWYPNGRFEEHSFYQNGQLHGESKKWWFDEQLCRHDFWLNHNIITKEIKDLVSNINNITDEEKFVILLKWGISLC